MAATVVSLENAQTDLVLGDTEHVLDLFAAAPEEGCPSAAPSKEEDSPAADSDDEAEVAEKSGAAGRGAKRSKAPSAGSGKRRRTEADPAGVVNSAGGGRGSGPDRWTGTLEFWSELERESTLYSQQFDLDSFRTSVKPSTA